MLPPEITRERAGELIRAQYGRPMATVAMAYAGRWWDVRGMSKAEVDQAILEITGLAAAELERKHIDISL